MTRLSLALAAAVLAASPAAAQAQAEQLVQTDTLAADTFITEPARSEPPRPDFEPVGPSQHAEEMAIEPQLGWRERIESTSSRASRGGASSVRVIRACEISLRLGDEDCAKP